MVLRSFIVAEVSTKTTRKFSVWPQLYWIPYELEEIFITCFGFTYETETCLILLFFSSLLQNLYLGVTFTPTEIRVQSPTCGNRNKENGETQETLPLKRVQFPVFLFSSFSISADTELAWFMAVRNGDTDNNAWDSLKPLMREEKRQNFKASPLKKIFVNLHFFFTVYQVLYGAK